MDKHWIPFFLRKIVSSVIGRIEHFTAKRIDAVISVNEPICERFRRSNSRVSMVANYPLNTEAEALKNIFEPRKPDQICYIGGLFPTRGIRELVMAMEHVDATLVLAGAFSPASFEEEIKALPGWKKVDFRGFIDRNEILRILKTSVLGVVTLHPTKSYVESLPIKMFEYMSAGLPVLASDFPMWKNIIEKEGCGMCVDPMDATAIADGIRIFIEHPSVVEEMGGKGAIAFEERYNWKAEEKKLFALYDQLLN
jgi:glycosyltransferase involved in cell wall biosynthesis